MISDEASAESSYVGVVGSVGFGRCQLGGTLLDIVQEEMERKSPYSWVCKCEVQGKYILQSLLLSSPDQTVLVSESFSNLKISLICG
jgi:hypothetical protein